jgi:hypothetical protein
MHALFEQEVQSFMRIGIDGYEGRLDPFNQPRFAAFEPDLVCAGEAAFDSRLVQPLNRAAVHEGTVEKRAV